VKKLRDLGWIAFFLLLMPVCLLCREKITLKLPFGRALDLDRRIDVQTKRLATVPWEDPRPLCLFLGDSQIESGNWYELFSGRHAVLNAGVSMARVTDVSTVVGCGSASQVDTVIVMCGINDLGAGEKPGRVMHDYERLLDLIAKKIRPNRTIVLSVMPVLLSGVDESRTMALNRSVNELNGMLAAMVKARGSEFLDLTTVVGWGGGLNRDLTSDGLHPNRLGYAVIAAAVAGQLGKTPANGPTRNTP